MAQTDFAATKARTKEQARQQAIEWQQWASEQSLSYSQYGYWQYYFETLARKFNLTKEFKENGIL